MIACDMIHFIALGFLSTFISILLFRPLATKIKLIDIPDARKQHKGEIPLIGGISLYTGILIFLIFFDDVNSSIEIILISSFFILILGIYDDFKNLRPKLKLFIQLFLVAISIYLSGLKIESLGFFYGFTYQIDLGLLAIPFSIISVVGLMNSFNMIDGLDGQAGLVSIIAIIGILTFGLDKVDYNLYKILLICFAGLIAFLIFNLTSNNKMKIFLGDGGSLFLGFLISFLLIYCSQILKLFSPSFALWCVSIPLFDFFSVVILRKIKNQKILISNRDHIHNFLEIFNYPKKLITFFTSIIGLGLLFLGYYLEVNFPSLSFWLFLIMFKFYLLIRLYYEQKVKIKNELF